MEIKELIKNNFVYFDSFRQGVFYYKVARSVTGTDYLGDTTLSIEWYLFPIPVEDIGSGTMLDKDKAIFFMRWIRKAIEEQSLMKV